MWITVTARSDVLPENKYVIWNTLICPLSMCSGIFRYIKHPYANKLNNNPVAIDITVCSLQRMSLQFSFIETIFKRHSCRLTSGQQNTASLKISYTLSATRLTQLRQKCG